ncbi:hypothetical protein ACQCVP_05155 [Rossellomorea vietnamensis]
MELHLAFLPSRSVIAKTSPDKDIFKMKFSRIHVVQFHRRIFPA